MIFRVGLLFLIVTALLGCASFRPSTADSQRLSFDATLSEFPYPYEVKYFDIKSQQQDLKMAYMYMKSKSKAKTKNLTAVLLHGKNFAGFYWKDIADYLLNEGYDVLIPDQIGFGKSSKPEHYQYSFSTLAMHTHSLANELGIQDQLIVGHSMGGMLATRYVLTYPEVAKKLILINPIGMEDYRAYVVAKDVDFFFLNEMAQTHEKVIEYQKKNYYDGNWKPKYEELTLIHKGWIEGPDWKWVAWNNALTYDLIFSEAVVHEVPNISVPFDLILGTRDRTAPGRNWMKPGVKRELGRYDRLGKEWRKLNPKIKLHELQGLGHMPQFEDFDAFTKAFSASLSGAK